MKAEKLSKVIQTNVPMNLRIKKRAGSYPETDFNTKQPTGRMTFLYIFEDDKGLEISHYATEQQEENLSLFQPGEWIQVVRGEKLNDVTGKRFTFYQFTPTEGAEARSAATPQAFSNTAETRRERLHEDQVNQQKAKEISIVLQAFTKSWIESGKATDPLSACALAKHTFMQHKQDVLDILSGS